MTWWCLVVGPLLASALWLWWEYAHAQLVDADEQPISDTPIGDAALDAVLRGES